MTWIKFKYATKLAVTSFGLVVAFSLVDAIAGGGIALVMRADGWNGPDQLVNRLYQVAFGIGVIATLFFIWQRARKTAALTAILVAGLWEDLFYYFMLPLSSPIIEFIIRDGWAGGGYRGIALPQYVSGYPHWLAKVFFGIEINFNRFEWFIFMLSALALWLSALSVLARIASRTERRSI